VLDTHKRGRYPRAAHTGATIYHYGWLKSLPQRAAKRDQISRHWGAPRQFVDSADIDPQVLKPFTGTHPKVIQDWLPPADGLFQANPNHKLTSRERKHRLMLRLEKWFGWQFRKKHYKRVA
jgi:hypothetical protein